MIATIRDHPKTRDAVLLEISPDAVRPLQEDPQCPALHWDRRRRAWVATTAALPDLRQLLLALGVVVIDDRDRPTQHATREPDPPPLDPEVLAAHMAQVRSMLPPRYARRPITSRSPL